MTLYFIAPDNPNPCGGLKTRYRHVDLLNRNGIPACILHEKAGFRCTWFANETPVAAFETLTRAHPSDLLVLTEVHGPNAHTMAKGLLKKVIFNQGIFNTFNGYPIETRPKETPYLHDEVIAVIVNSDYAADYLRLTFPEKPLYRIHYGINTALFHPRPKKKQIAFLTSKNPRDLLQVINMLRYRGALNEWTLAPIERKTEAETAELLGESSVFLNFTAQEGFGMPAAEALASGCLVVGYDGISGREYLRPEFSRTVPTGDILAFVEQVENILALLDRNPPQAQQMREASVAFIRKHYTPAIEEQELLAAWRSILTNA